MKTPFFLAVGFFPLTLIALALTSRSRNLTKDQLYFLSLFIVGLFLSVGASSKLNFFLANHIPFFNVVFSMPVLYGGFLFVLGYAVMLGLSHSIVSSKAKNRSLRMSVSMAFVAAIIINGYPTWTGEFIYPGNEVYGSGRYHKPESYDDLKRYFENEGLSYRIFSYPYSKLGYMMYDWPPKGFTGPDIVENIIGRPVLSGVGFGMKLAAEMIKKDADSFRILAGAANVKNILLHRDANNEFLRPSNWYITNDSIYELQRWLGTHFIKTASFGGVDLYRIGDKTFLPRFYASEFPDCTRGSTDSRSLCRPSNDVIVEYRTVNPVTHRIRIHGARGKISLIFSDSFDKGWKIYPSRYERKQIDLSSADRSTRVFRDGATTPQIETYVMRGWVSELSRRGSGGKRSYISPAINGAIQNDNLPTPSLFEILRERPLNESGHFMANGFSNGWQIDVDQLCAQGLMCSDRADGSVDFELIVEFAPQRLYYLGMVISSFTFLTGILVTLLSRRRCNRDRVGPTKVSILSD
jgi:hypothetical protein